MSKLAQIRSIVAEAKEMVEEVEREVVESVGEYNLTLTELESLKESISLSDLHEMQDALSSIQNLPQEPAKKLAECEDKLISIDPPQPYEVKEPKSGTFAAKFWGFMVALFTFMGLGILGAYFKKLNFDPSLIDMKFVEQAFSFYSDLLTGSSGSAAALGITAAGLVAVGIGYIVYWVMISAAASSNLSRAQALFEGAKEYVQQQREFLQHLKRWKEFLKKAVQTLKGAKLFSDELSAKVERIKFFEGNDYQKYRQNSQQDIADLIKLNHMLVAFVEMEICKKEDEIDQEVQKFFNELEKMVERIKQRVYS